MQHNWMLSPGRCHRTRSQVPIPFVVSRSAAAPARPSRRLVLVPDSVDGTPQLIQDCEWDRGVETPSRPVQDGGDWSKSGQNILRFRRPEGFRRGSTESGRDVFLTNEVLKTTLSKSRKKEAPRAQATQHPSLEVAGVPQHLVHGSCGTVTKGESKGPSSGTCKNRTTPPHPRRVGSALQGLWHVRHFSGC